MSGTAEVERARAHCNAELDILDVELGDLKRTSTIAYEDLVLLHFGRSADRAGELRVQVLRGGGVTC